MLHPGLVSGAKNVFNFGLKYTSRANDKIKSIDSTIIDIDIAVFIVTTVCTDVRQFLSFGLLLDLGAFQYKMDLVSATGLSCCLGHPHLKSECQFKTQLLPLQTQLPANPPGSRRNWPKCFLTTQMGNADKLLAPDFGLAQPWLPEATWGVNQQISLNFFFSVTLPFK